MFVALLGSAMLGGSASACGYDCVQHCESQKAQIAYLNGVPCGDICADDRIVEANTCETCLDAIREVHALEPENGFCAEHAFGPPAPPANECTDP
ncbi:MAG: hypothetical protein IT383_14575 [Deltaproteobacteria bacterium]|nr:hypothetical protein [Deltaproteobacteria bacterium]